jgi:hypothetical protein
VILKEPGASLSVRSIAADIDFLDMVLVGLFFESQTVEKTIKSGNATQVDYDNFRSAEPTES